MFRCAITKKLSKPGDKAIKLVTATRERFYFEQKNGVEDSESGEVIGQGSEIVSEVNVTLEGLKQWTIQHPEDTASEQRYQELYKAEQAQKLRALQKKPEQTNET